MDNRAGEMMVFVRVVEAGSFSEAARAMLMTPSTVSKLIARLEARIGVRLIERSTRRLVLTSEGQFYYERSRSLVSQIDETEQLLTQGNAKPEGLIRVSSSVTFGSAALEPVLAAFLEAYPGVVVDLSLSDELVDHLDRTDVAIRLFAAGFRLAGAALGHQRGICERSCSDGKRLPPSGPAPRQNPAAQRFDSAPERRQHAAG